MRNYDFKYDRDRDSYGNRYEQEYKPTQPKTGYKYTYYKDPS